MSKIKTTKTEAQRLGPMRVNPLPPTDAREAAARLLDKKFFECPHLQGTENPAGDYEIRCSVCGQGETYPRTGHKEVDALTSALNFAAKHTHKS